MKKKLKKALGHAIMIIENYEMDIRDSSWTGVDLVKKGFCQGSVYKEAISDIEKFKNGELE